MSCLLAGIATIALTGSDFRLEWTHSIEHTAWREEWRIENGAMRPVRAAIKGIGAGMEPGPDAHLEDGWLVWVPAIEPQRELLLAASGATGAAWQLCDGIGEASVCREIGRARGAPVRLAPCPGR